MTTHDCDQDDDDDDEADGTVIKVKRRRLEPSSLLSLSALDVVYIKHTF